MTEVTDLRKMYFEEGKHISQIKKKTGFDRKTIRKFVDKKDWNDQVQIHAERESKLDKFKPKIDEWLEADKEMLKVVFANLLQNAVKYTIDREKACIEIGKEQKEDYIQFYIKDNGVGFDMNFKGKLFEPFQRIHTDERFTGSGIGLATVERIISKHGGKIWAEGEVDKGATFYFTLPSKTHVED